jgi:hypothetical protein
MGLLVSRGRKRPQFKWRPTQFEQGASVTLPAPYGGINLRSDITALAPYEARSLENWLPGAGQCDLRPGFGHHASGVGSAEVKTLVPFHGYTASKLIATGGGNIYDVTLGTQEDGNDTYTKVLLQFDGADGGTTITDSNAGGSSHTWTAAGNANTDNAQVKFGMTSLACDGTGDYVSTADHADFSLGSGDFTIDLWFRCTATTGSSEAIAGQGDVAVTAATTAWSIFRTTTDIIRANVYVGGSIYQVDGTTTFTDVASTGWHHLALVRTSNTLKLFIDGTQEGTDVAISGTVNNATDVLAVGALGAYVAEPWTGWIDEFRISVGIARWTDDFDVPTGPHAPTRLATSFSDDRWQTALYSDRLFFVNGLDNPQVYDGSTVAAIVWSGSGLSADNDLINIALVRNRLWFCEKEKARVWYGAIGQITAASPLTVFDLQQIASGGICMAIGSWSRDAGDGADDMTVFVMSTGEILIYQGDPGSTFSLIGKYWTGAPPIGRQCLFKIGGELMVITSLGLLPVSAAIGGVALDLSRIDPWGKIAAGIVADAALDSGNAGWHGVLHNGIVYVNVVQTEAALSKQWVINTRNGACATYSGWHPSSMASFGGDLYFGSMAGGFVRLVGGEDDDGESITANANCAFTFPTQGQRNNLFTAIRPVMDAEGTVTGLIGVDTNFVVRTLSGASVSLIEDPSTTPWGSEWGSPWGSSGGARPNWFSIRGEGRSVSVRMRAVNTALNCRWYSTDLLFKPGGIR